MVGSTKRWQINWNDCAYSPLRGIQPAHRRCWRHVKDSMIIFLYSEFFPRKLLLLLRFYENNTFFLFWLLFAFEGRLWWIQKKNSEKNNWSACDCVSQPLSVFGGLETFEWMEGARCGMNANAKNKRINAITVWRALIAFSHEFIHEMMIK